MNINERIKHLENTIEEMRGNLAEMQEAIQGGEEQSRFIIAHACDLARESMISMREMAQVLADLTKERVGGTGRDIEIPEADFKEMGRSEDIQLGPGRLSPEGVLVAIKKDVLDVDVLTASQKLAVIQRFTERYFSTTK